MNDTKKAAYRKPLPIPGRVTLEKAVEHLSFAERGLLYLLTAILIGSALTLLFRVNDFLLVDVPTHGGSLTEGVIGSPRFVNPLLAVSDADRDLTSLVYSGLLKALPDGTLTPDLAQSYAVSEDGLTYTFLLKNNIYFDDGTPITTDDVEFTVQKAQDPSLKSPKRANWDSVMIQKISPREIRFVLKQPYAPFLENATLGILPKHIWKDVSADEFPLSYFNIEPIGSGPFMIDKITRNSSGIPEKYVLVPFKNYALGEPYLGELNLAFYANEQTLVNAFNAGAVDSINGISPENVGSLNTAKSMIRTTPLSRIFGVFFNQNQVPVFADEQVRLALDTAIDKQQIVDQVLSGYGVVATGPVPPGFIDSGKNLSDESTTSEARIAAAKSILEKDGWSLGSDGIYVKTDKKKKSTQRLSFSISTSDAAELKAAANLVRDTWQKMGVAVDVKIFEPGDLSQNIIRPRKYDALLFGEVIGRDLDLFAFWHSSQRNDPGLNIALYTNSKTDKLLADARATSDRGARLDKYAQFIQIIQADVPTVFLYSPSFIYVTPKNLYGANVGHITVPSDRFENVADWYVNTEKVWKIFMNKQQEENATKK